MSQRLIGDAKAQARIDELEQRMTDERREGRMEPSTLPWDVVIGEEADDWGITERGKAGKTVAQMLWEWDAKFVVEVCNSFHAHQQALRAAQEALKAQQDLLECVNEENPWLGVTAGLALRIRRLKTAEQQAREAQEEIARLKGNMKAVIEALHPDYSGRGTPEEGVKALIQRAQALEREVVLLTDQRNGYKEQREKLEARVREAQVLADEKCRCFLERAEKAEYTLDGLAAALRDILEDTDLIRIDLIEQANAALADVSKKQ